MNYTKMTTFGTTLLAPGGLNHEASLGGVGDQCCVYRQIEWDGQPETSITPTWLPGYN